MAEFQRKRLEGQRCEQSTDALRRQKRHAQAHVREARRTLAGRALPRDEFIAGPIWTLQSSRLPGFRRPAAYPLCLPLCQTDRAGAASADGRRASHSQHITTNPLPGRPNPAYLVRSMRIGIFSDTHANLEALIRGPRGVSEGKYRRLLLPRRHGRVRRLAERVRRSRPRALQGHDPRQPRRGRLGRMDYSYYYEAARHALDVHAAMISPENMAWLKGLPYQHKLDGRRPPALPRLPGPARGVRVHLRAGAGARVPSALGQARPHHAHWPLAPLQGVRADEDQR